MRVIVPKLRENLHKKKVPTYVETFVRVIVPKLRENLHKKKVPTYVETFVRVIGLEPTRLAAPDPKSGMSTNFTIPAIQAQANLRQQM